jgi:general secretion pathway protein K
VRRTWAQPSRSGRNDGFIIIAVLWIIVALAALAATYAYYVGNTASALKVNDDRIKAEALMTAGIELAVYRMTLSPAADVPPPPSGVFRFRLGGAGVAVGYKPENARIDLNAAPKPLLAGLFRALGAQTDAAAAYADRIVGWRTPVRNDADDEETSRYRAAGLTYGPRHAPFVHPDELWLVAGIPDALKRRARDFVTVYSGQPDVDIAAADPMVIAALPGMIPERLDALLRQRAQPGGAPPLAIATQPSRARRIDIAIGFDNGRRSGGEAVVLLAETGSEPYRVLSWRNDFDAPPPGTQTRTVAR